MKKFTFTVTTEQTDCYTVYWKNANPPINTEQSKDFPTEKEARKFAGNLAYDANVLSGIRCEYRRIIDLDKATSRLKSDLVFPTTGGTR